MIDISVLLERAGLLLDQGRVNDAIREVQTVLGQEPGNDEALSLYARCLFDKGRFDEGIDCLRQAIHIDPEKSFYFYLLGFAYYRKDENLAAVTQLEKAISMNPYVAEYFGLLAFTHLEEKAFDTALAKANEGLAIDPENLTCLNARSTALNKLRKTDAAIQTMEHALSMDPDNEFTHATVGWNFLEKGRHKDAAKHFREALRINPDYANARAGLKEALKARIPPYKWLLRYSFWVNNQGKKASWAIPLGIFIIVRVLASVFNSSESTTAIGGLIIGIYLVFVITTWIINPIANFVLLFHRDGKYALDTTEKWTALTVVGSIITGSILLVPAISLGEKGGVYPPLMLATVGFWAMAVPLGNIQYPISLRHPGSANKFALLLTSLGLLTIILGFFYFPAAMVPGILFVILFVLNNWIGLFR